MREQQKLMAKVIDIIAETFDKHAVLRGGMVLSILGCDRWTNDIDYLFVPYKSKKDVVSELTSALKAIPGSKVKHSINSQCLRIELTVGDVSTQIEVKVDTKAKTDLVSTRELSEKFNLPARIIPVMDNSVALANKMAAWNERRLARDIYDVVFFLNMGVEQDIEILSKRLNKVRYSPIIKQSEKFKGRTVLEFYDFITETISKTSENDLKKQLEDYVTAGRLMGIKSKILASIAKLKL